MRKSAGTYLALVALALPALAAFESRPLSFQDRLRAQEAIERARYAHQIGASKTFEQAVPQQQLERKVRTYLKQSVALERFWQTRVTPEMLRRELERIVRGTEMPNRLREIFAALDDDVLRVQECLVRPVLVDRLARSSYAFDGSLHAAARQEAESLREALASGSLNRERDDPRRVELELLRGVEGDGHEGAADPSTRTLPATEFARWRARLSEGAAVEEDRDAFHVRVLLDETPVRMRVADYRVEKVSWDEWWTTVSPGLDETSITTVLPLDASLATALREIAHEAVPEASSDAGCDTWNATSTLGASSAHLHRAVWTGNVMIVWGGVFHTGGRYDPVLDAWQPTSSVGAPLAFWGHTAVWAGDVMIVWGGTYYANDLMTGGRYDPLADTWTPTSTVGAPVARSYHTAVWTGGRMIVWGGSYSVEPGTFYRARLRDGGRYDPVADVWTPTSIGAGVPVERDYHSAIWTGNRMVVWGGSTVGTLHATGGRYDPIADAWAPTSTVGTPSAREGHTAIWTGSRMVVWGGGQPGGGRYDPLSNTWAPVSTTNAPATRFLHTAVWSGSEMIVWGGYTSWGALDTGGRYDPVSDTWKATSTLGAPPPRHGHTAVWAAERMQAAGTLPPASDLMIVWGGTANVAGIYLSSGSRYVPGDLPTYTHYPDADGDGSGSSLPHVEVCDCDATPPPGYVASQGDCDDANPSVHPGATEICNGIDDNCVNGVDESGANLCADGIDCTSDACQNGRCLNVPDDSRCADGIYCTYDACQNGGCLNIPDDSRCADGIACTVDFCDGTSGCHNTPDDTLCNDGSSCTVDRCDPVASCVHAPNGECEHNPRDLGYWTAVCASQVPENAVTAADVDCLTGLCTFAGVSSASELCDRLRPAPVSDPCAQAEAQLMALVLNVCKGRVGSQFPILSACGSTSSVGESLLDADSILCNSPTPETCSHARCESEESATGRALSTDSLRLARELGGIRLTWSVPYTPDVGPPASYQVWRRSVPGEAFILAHETTELSWVDGAADPRAQYEIRYSWAVSTELADRARGH